MENKKYIAKRRNFDVEVFSVNPVGEILVSAKSTITIVDDPESMIDNMRIFISIGEHKYEVDKKGLIINRLDNE